MTKGDIRVLGFSRRTGRSEAGCEYAVKFIVEGESGDEMMWLDEFLDRYAPRVRIMGEGNRELREV